MNIYKAAAIVGIWMGVGWSSAAAGPGIVLVALFAMAATMVIAIK